jgi:hypothetical protein
MIERKELHRLVISTIQDSSGTLKAVQLYEELRVEHPKVLKDESVRGFKSFVQILNTIPEVRPIGKGVKFYVLKKQK